MDLITLERGRTRVAVAPAFGGRIAQIALRDGGAWLPLLYEPPRALPDRDPLLWGSYAVLPWPNRIAGGTFPFEGRTHRLRQNDGPNALHGLGYTAAWTVADASGGACTLSLDLSPAWPFGGRAEQHIEALDDGVRQRITLFANEGAYPCGAGWHPWFRRDVRPGEAMRVLIDSDERYELAAMIPTGRIVPVEGDFDFRDYPAVSTRQLDDCYRGVRGPLRVRWGDLELTMASSANAGHAVVYSKHPAAVCIEPQTCAIDAFNLAARWDASTGVQWAEPGRPFVAETDWRWRIGAP
jgi:galactose mutarotase-like enzyme